MHANDTMGNGSTAKGGSAALLASAVPELYQINAYRISELSVQATDRDFSKRLQFVDQSVKIGHPVPPGNCQILPLPVGQDPESVRASIQRLRDMERRLVDIFFWFWPHQQGDPRSDPALKELNLAHYQQAAEIWASQEDSDGGSHIATHNLAILGHLLAMDWELHARSSTLSDQEQADLAANWKGSFERWRSLHAHKGFWSELGQIVKNLDDPRLNEGTVSQMRDSLPAALLLINFRLAVQATEQGNPEEAKRHIAIIDNSGFGSEARRAAGRLVAQPLRARITTLAKTVEEAVRLNAAEADKPVEELLDLGAALLPILELVLSTDYNMVIGASDEIASAAFNALVQFASKTQQWGRSAELLARAESTALSAPLKANISKNLGIVRQNASASGDWGGIGDLDLPEDARAVLLKAQHYAGAKQWDLAVGSVSRVYQRFPKSRVASLLAACLTNRAIERWQANAAAANLPGETEQLIRERIDDKTYRSSKCAACAENGAQAFASVEIQGIRVTLCANCVASLQAEQLKRLEKIREGAEAALSDVALAADLDRASEPIRQGYSQLKMQAAQVGVHPPKVHLLHLKYGLLGFYELLNTLKDRDSSIRLGAETALQSAKLDWVDWDREDEVERLVTSLRSLLKSRRKLHRLIAVNLLGQAGPKAAEATDDLLQADRDARAVRRAALAAIQRVNPTMAAQALANHRRRNRVRLAWALGAGLVLLCFICWGVLGIGHAIHVGRASYTLHSLGLISTDDAAKSFQSTIGDGSLNPGRRQQAIRFLERIDPRQTNAIPVLTMVLMDPDGGIRADAEAALPRIDPNWFDRDLQPEVQGWALNALASGIEGVKLNSLKLLEKVDPVPPRVLPELLKLTSDSNPIISEAAANTCMRIVSPVLVQWPSNALEEALETSAANQAQLVACALITKHFPDQYPDLSKLGDLVKLGRTSEVRTNALLAIENQLHPEAIDLIF